MSSSLARTVSTAEYTLIDTLPSLATVVREISDLPTSPPSLYLDIEGENLCRHGTIAIIQVYVLPHRKTYLLDITTLGADAFTFRESARESSLKELLESPSIPKCFFDVRSDADALYGLYDISMQGIQDIQVMQFAARQLPRGARSGMFLTGLAKCIVHDAGLTLAAAAEFERRKNEGRKIFVPDFGGSSGVISERPLREEVLVYCVGDVAYLPALWQKYTSILGNAFRAKIRSATLKRVDEAKGPYRPQGKWRAHGPW